MSPSSCIVLVPVAGNIELGCEQSLHELERRGYTVRRVLGYSAIDFGRCCLASNALDEGFEELMWIDSDVVFHPDDVERLRAHQLPIVCGVYAKKSGKEFACNFVRTDKEYQVVFGKTGGIYEINYAGFGFVHTRRQIYETMRARLQLPECNQRFGKPVIPYFMPMLIPDGNGLWYLSEDYAFCERAKHCGFKIMADTTIMLWHVGHYGFSWQDIDNSTKRSMQQHPADTAASPAPLLEQPRADPSPVEIVGQPVEKPIVEGAQLP